MSTPRPGIPALSPAAACAARPELFQDPLLEEPPSGGASASTRRRYRQLVVEAGAVCHDCLLLADCLHAAVVRHDVAGFVAGTTSAQRGQLRRLLGVRVEPENLDLLTGLTTPNRQVDHNEVVRLRRANPEESLETLARRLGCSLSTVKRHLRRERRAPARPAVRRPLPTRSEVTDAAARLLRPAPAPARVAASRPVRAA